MKFLNSIIAILIVAIYTLAFTIKPLGAAALAGCGSETEVETEIGAETEADT